MPASAYVFRDLTPQLADFVHPYGDDVAAIWADCPNAEWLILIGLAVDVPRRTLVHAATDLVADALLLRQISDIRPRRALLTSVEWLGGSADGSRTWAAGFAAMDAAATIEDPIAAEAIRAAACAAFACDERADAAYYRHEAYAARAVVHALRAFEGASESLPGLSLATPADRVRSRIGAAAVVDGFRRTSRPPPPIPESSSPSGPNTDSFYC